MTRKEYNLAVISILNGNEVTDDTRNEVIAYATDDNKKIADRNAKRATKPTKAQVANAPLIPLVLASLNSETPTLTTAVASAIGENSQKANGILGNLYKEHKVTKVVVPVKGKGKQTGWLLVSADENSAE